jgi:hypothetical protein
MPALWESVKKSGVDWGRQGAYSGTMIDQTSFKRLILRATLRHVSRMVIRLVSVSDQVDLIRQILLKDLRQIAIKATCFGRRNILPGFSHPVFASASVEDGPVQTEADLSIKTGGMTPGQGLLHSVE